MRIKYYWKWLCLLLLILIATSPGIAENLSPESDEMQLTTSIQEALDIEEKNINRLDVQIAEEEAFSTSMLLEFSSFRLQFSTRSNLILMQETSVKNLEKASEENVLALNKIQTRIQDINNRAKKVDALIVKTTDEININEKQLKALEADSTKSSDVKNLISGYRKLQKKMQAKQKLLIDLKGIYLSVVENIVKVEQDFNLLSKKFDQEIRTRKRIHLFQRNVFPKESTGKTLFDDSEKLLDQFFSILSATFWLKEIKFIKTVGSFNLISFFVVYGIVLLVFLRLKYLLNKLTTKELFKTFWITVVLKMLEQTLFLIATVLFLFVFSQSGILYSRTPILLTVLNLLSVLLFSRWFLIALDKHAIYKSGSVFAKTTFRIRSLLYISSLFAILCVLGNWLFVDANIVFIVVRILFLSVLYVWCLWFWRFFYQHSPLVDNGQKDKKAIAIDSMKYLIYGVLLIGILADITGFGTFAFYWLTSWARSSVVILWAFLLFLSAIELSHTQPPLPSMNEEDYGKKIPVHWFVSRIGLLILAVFIFISIVFAWGGKQAVLINIYKVLDKPFSIGSWEISILHIVYAVTALFITNAVAVTWRQFFQEIILKESGIDIGVQDSVSTISYYIIWFVGILAALNLFGVSMKSVTLLFGALGIGLGFGLQTIFNNFISGIILLFERPIQVGDDLEIDGVWATVRKINVRSTVVQTYDNATLIIPNSEFVSAKVINWSFKDKRIRRRIEVGVAYGSDVDLVKKTLLDVASRIPKVLKLPKPDVHFTNFGDNSLVFVLRLWTRVEYFMAVETDARFEIDQLFRKNNIEISFPQRDIHIRSIDEKDMTAVLSKINPPE